MGKAASKKASKKSTKRLDSVGWVFWLICFLPAYPVGYYLSYQAAYEDQKTGLLPWVLGFVLAALGAGIVTWVVNSVLQLIDKQRRKTEPRPKKAGR